MFRPNRVKGAGGTKLMEKLFFGVIIATVVLYILSNAFVPAVNDSNWTDIGGENYNWTLLILVILVMVGVVIAIYRHMVAG